jgi:hypothetical protein
MKHFVYKHFDVIMVCLFLIVIFVTIHCMDSWESRIPLIAAFVSLVFFIQKHKLEELHLFSELFKEFNGRYNELNETLNKIKSRTDELTDKDEDIKLVNVLYDYFNLCGEEYLYYKEGYILPDVWKAWKNGMKIFFDDPKIKRVWDKDCNTESYYGFNPHTK